MSSAGIYMILAVMLFSLGGCPKSVNVEEVAPGDLAGMGAGEALIFGRTRLLDNGKEKESYRTTSDQLDLMLVRMEDEQALAVRHVLQDGTFLWKVPRGTYLLTRVRWWEFRGWFPIRPQVAFQVGADAPAYYLGTPRIDAEIERSALSVKLKAAAVRIDDEYGRDAEVLTRRLPDFRGRVGKALMGHDVRIPSVTESEVKQATFLSILQALGFGLMTIP